MRPILTRPLFLLLFGLLGGCVGSGARDVRLTSVEMAPPSLMQATPDLRHYAKIFRGQYMKVEFSSPTNIVDLARKHGTGIDVALFVCRGYEKQVRSFDPAREVGGGGARVFWHGLNLSDTWGGRKFLATQKEDVNIDPERDGLYRYYALFLVRQHALWQPPSNTFDLTRHPRDLCFLINLTNGVRYFPSNVVRIRSDLIQGALTGTDGQKAMFGDRLSQLKP